MPHRPYPAFQLECVTTLIDITRRGALREEIPEAAKCAYDLGGAVLGATIGEPDDVIVGDEVTQVGAQVSSGLDGIELQDLETCHAQLSAALPELEAFGASGFGEDAEAVDISQLDPAMVALFMQIALKALEFFMNRKKKS